MGDNLNTIDRLATYVASGSPSVEMDIETARQILILARAGYETASGKTTTGEPARKHCKCTTPRIRDQLYGRFLAFLNP